jgi:hypothetical protein
MEACFVFAFLLENINLISCGKPHSAEYLWALLFDRRDQLMPIGRDSVTKTFLRGELQ